VRIGWPRQTPATPAQTPPISYANRHRHRRAGLAAATFTAI
jgi:hypothetical protein